MNPSDEFNVDSFMGVIKATRQDQQGIFIPGELMPSGKPVRSDGVSVDNIMKDKGMAEGWFTAVRAQHAREKEERDHSSSVQDAPELVIGGGDTAAREPAPSAPAASETYETLEEELQARSARWETLMERAAWERDRAQKDYDEAKAEWKRAQRALDAIREED